LRKRGIEDREAAKTFFFSWLYNPASNKVESSVYDREAILERYYFDKHVHTIFNRKLEVDDYKAVNYIIQSTTADLVNERAVAIDKFLEGKKSFISHIVHDEVVVDMPDDERYLIPEMRDIFSNNRLGNFKTNLKAGQDYMEIGVLNL
jgi:DNA polymerase I-like protein with 3'-5' exonuclease and polymerase domains